MFTGIVTGIGLLQTQEDFGQDRRMRFTVPAELQGRLQLGDSVAVNGVCLTVKDLHQNGFSADLSAETLACTTAGAWQDGQTLNFEAALTLASPLGGHLVSGHVDGVGELLDSRDAGRSLILRFGMPTALRRFIAVKGSVCIDGVSLTVNALDVESFSVNLVPHTLAVTTFGAYRAGQRVNLEVDLLARYLERLLQEREI